MWQGRVVPCGGGTLQEGVEVWCRSWRMHACTRVHARAGGRTSRFRHRDEGVSARSTGLLGYHATMEPSFREKREPVEGHSMQKSCKGQLCVVGYASARRFTCVVEAHSQRLQSSKVQPMRPFKSVHAGS